MPLIWIDTESVGLVGPTKMIQWLIDDNEPDCILLPQGWERDPETRRRVGWLLDLCWHRDTTMYMYNAPHDVLHLCKVYHALLGYKDTSHARPVPPPRSKIIDLQIHATFRSPLAPFAMTSRGVATVKRIPNVAVPVIEGLVTERLQGMVPSTVEMKVKHHEVKGRPDLVTLSWGVSRQLRLKTLMKVWGFPTIELDAVWPLPDRLPKACSPLEWDKGEMQVWPYEQECHRRILPECDRILLDPNHDFRRYAMLDPVFTRVAWEKLDRPLEPNYNDDCAAMVGYTRYAGLPLDLPTLQLTVHEYQARVDEATAQVQGINMDSPVEKVALLKRHIPWIESSKKEVLEILVAQASHPDADDDILAAGRMAQAFINYTTTRQRLNQALQMALCLTGRMHVDLKVVGTNTDRMAGAGQFNVQGIARGYEMTPDGRIFGLRASTLVAGGGDFDNLEMGVMAALYKDKNMQADLDNKVDLHMMTASLMSPLIKGMGYEQAYEILHSKAHADRARVKRARDDHGKRLNFAMGYGCEAPKAGEVLGGSEELGQAALDQYFGRYRGLGAARLTSQALICTADTENWTRDSVSRMAEYCESILGTRRYFLFEKQVACLMWEMGQKPPALGPVGQHVIVRQDHKGPQTIANACKSAFLGSAIMIQQAVSRRFFNTPVQMSGSQMCKILASRLWREYGYPTVPVHDELNQGRDHEGHYNLEGVQAITRAFLSEHQKLIPALNIEIERMERWSDK